MLFVVVGGRGLLHLVRDVKNVAFQRMWDLHNEVSKWVSKLPFILNPSAEGVWS